MFKKKSHNIIIITMITFFSIVIITNFTYGTKSNFWIFAADLLLAGIIIACVTCLELYYVLRD